MNASVEEIRRQFIETAGNTTQSIGSGRILGQIFAYVYLSPAPRALDDMTRDLGVSKGSASMTVRQLEQWGALHRVWVKGERRDYYEASEDFGRFVRRALLDLVESRVQEAGQFLGEAEETLRSLNGRSKAEQAEVKFVRRRLQTLKKFRDRARWIWDKSIIRLLVKK